MIEFFIGMAVGTVALFLLGRKGAWLQAWWWERKQQKAMKQWLEKHHDDARPVSIFKRLG
jgi:hypothetical protein